MAKEKDIMKVLRTVFGATWLLALIAVSVTACTRENYHPSEAQRSILDGPDRSQEWYKTNDDGK